MKFTNIALQTSIEIKNYCVRSTTFFASSKSVSVYTVDRKINGLVFKSLSDYNQIYRYEENFFSTYSHFG